MELKVHHHFTDGQIDWEQVKLEGYGQIRDEGWPIRDRSMAESIIEGFTQILASEAPRRKALVIMNYRHAFRPILSAKTGEPMGNCAEFTFEAFPDRVANIMLNTVAVGIGPNGEMLYIPVNDGRWDAGFEVTGNHPTGFDFAGSPMGEDTFDLFPVQLIQGDYRYEDVFDGFVFYRPLREHYFAEGIPGLFDDGFREEFLARSRALGDSYYQDQLAYLDAYEITSIRNPYGDDVLEGVRQWITSTPISIENVGGAAPAEFSLGQNYPNPFNGDTLIRFLLSRAGDVELSVYDLAGQKVATLVSGLRQAGSYQIRWAARDERGEALASGAYYYRLRTEAGVQTRGMVLLR